MRLSAFTALTVATTFLLAACGGEQTASSPSEGAHQSASQPAEQTSASATPSPTPTPEELPGGGQEVFDGKRYIALYGAPGRPSLGVLGEQDAPASVARVQELVDQYQPHATETVVPAFEVIVTTASSAPGVDGDYSDAALIEDIEPLIKEAYENDVYVVIDFQPGHSDFLSQVRLYEDLLKYPNVGVGLDPEWRLAPGQVHLQQIGSVTAAEINDTLDYLADFTRKNDLPQKMVVLHQFTHTMISNRETITVTHPELALTLHADGHGSPELKVDTYNSLLTGLNKEIYPSWKNFYDEDTPTMTPAQTYELDPKPWVVTYQ
ncbi:hypothetical protein [Rothia sp. ZJ1223]|uniref:hypothetical protein n=1 Tax=Rothia sp. ZJ1223 TaxID=2811098 RepID=UPI00195BCE98|nr:hypothetical protein [Rothia sp. ZJ1223]MBM7052093.1 hypothetical protein [Rothia sp. ZJ1223]